MADGAKSDDKAGADATKFDVAVEKDTTAQTEKTSGLAAVYAGKSCSSAADDISDLLISASNGQPVSVLVVTDGSLLKDADVSEILRLEIEAFEDRLNAADIQLDEPAETQEEPNDDDQPQAEGLVGIGTTIGVALAGIGVLTKLIAHQYTTSGAPLEQVALGLDLRVAGSIRSKLGSSTTGKVAVERFWVGSNSDLLKRMKALARAHGRVLDKVALAAERAETTKAVLDDAIAAKASARLLMQELCKVSTVGEVLEEKSGWSEAWKYAESAAGQDLATIANDHSQAAADLIEIKSLQDDLESVIVSALAADGQVSSILTRAMRAEWLSEDKSRIVLYVRSLAAGLDQVLETKLGPDRREVMAGTSIEYAAVGSGRELIFAGVFDNLWGGSMTLDNVADFKGHTVDYTYVTNAHRVEPVSHP